MGSFDAAICSPSDDPVGEGPSVVDALHEVREERLPNKGCGTLESPGGMIDGHEGSGQHDAVWILDGDCTAHIKGPMCLYFKKEPELRCRHLDPVEGSLPFNDLKAGLFLDFSRQRTDERLAGVDHTARGTPIDRLILAFVLDQQDLTTDTSYDAARHLPLAQGGWVLVGPPR